MEREIWEVLRHLNKATGELNRCLIMARDAGIETTILALKKTLDQDGKQVEFGWVEVHVNSRCLVN